MLNNIDFPKLGIHLELNPVLFTLGPFTVHWYGIITALAFLVIIAGVLKSSQKYGLKQDDLIDMLLFTAPLGIIGARIFYVLVNWSYYQQNLSEVYKIWHGGLAIYGGIVVGIITIFLFCRHRKINALQVLDHLVVYLALGQSVGRWGNFVNQELFGPNTNLPWGMTGDIIRSTIILEQYPGVNPELPVHPLFLYESLWSLAAFFILMWFRKKKKLQGEVFCLYMISYGLARFTIDSLRFDLKVGSVNINRVFGILFVVAFIGVILYRRLRLKKAEDQGASYQPSQYRDILDTMDQEPVEKPLPVADQSEQSMEKVKEPVPDQEDPGKDETAEDAEKDKS